jgi:hypothetical protein
MSEAPAGHIHEPVLADDWRLVAGAKRCRLMQARKACGAPAVAELDRSRWADARPHWWAYCAEHMFGRWVEDGQVWEWRVVPAPVLGERVEALIAALEAEVAWQRKMYGDSTDPAEKTARGRLIGMEDALRTVREHLTPKAAADADR